MFMFTYVYVYVLCFMFMFTYVYVYVLCLCSHMFLQITRETFTYVLHIVALPELTRYIAIDYILIFARNVWHS